MKHIKRTTAILLTLIMAITFISCQEVQSQPENTPDVPVSAEVNLNTPSVTPIMEPTPELRNITPMIAAGSNFTVGLSSNGNVLVAGYCESLNESPSSTFADVIAVNAGRFNTVFLTTKGTVITFGENRQGQCNVSDWKDIVSVVTSGYHTVGLKKDGTVVAVGNNEYGECNVTDWTDIIAVSAAWGYTIGLKSDGTVIVAGNNEAGDSDFSSWTNIIAIDGGTYHAVGLKSDGTVVAVETNGARGLKECDVSALKNVIAISAAEGFTAALKDDGTVAVIGDKSLSLGYDLTVVDLWADIVAIDSGALHIVGLKSDGTVVTAGRDITAGLEDGGSWSDPESWNLGRTK